MKVLFLLITFVSVSCGKKIKDECRSREHMRVQCEAETMPNYGRPYAQDYCRRTYEINRCY